MPITGDRLVFTYLKCRVDPSPRLASGLLGEVAR